jgi:dCMP deaminase
MKWDSYFLDIANTVREKSKDPSTKVGVVIVGPDKQIVSTGFNGFPRAVNESSSERWERPTKYDYVEHAERNAIYNAARHGIALRGCMLYMVGLGPPTIPCFDCARAIIQSGITLVIGRSFKPVPDRWLKNLKGAQSMLTEAGVVCLEEQP